jgi:hypothetical protein
MGWQQLADIYRTAADEYAEQRVEPPTACPNDGQPLEPGPGGVLHCRFDGWQWPRDAEGVCG